MPARTLNQILEHGHGQDLAIVVPGEDNLKR